MNSTVTARKSEQGFTLVELAIVMIIIGLLLGGLLKGQELIMNARVASTASSVKAIDAATTTFRDKYNGMPGDILTPAARIPGCTALPCSAAPAASNGLVGNNAFGAAPAGETLAFFPQLGAAGLIGGVISTAVAPNWSGNYPEAPVGGGFHMSYVQGGVLANLPGLSTTGMTVTNIRSGHYLALHNDAGGSVAADAASQIITPNVAFRIETKIDDGRPATGSVFAGGVPGGAAGCATAVGDAAVYNEVRETQDCYLFIRFNE